MNNLQHTTYTLPAHWAGILINNDYSSVSIEEEHELDKFIDGEFGEALFCTVSVAGDSESFFCKYHDAQPYGIPACDCLKFTFIH
jgi:hypothetical protein